MKKLLGIVVVLFLGIMFGNIGHTDAASDMGTKVELNDSHTKLEVELEANATTGYEWSYSFSKKGILSCVKDSYEIDDDDDIMLDGQGGEQEYEFKAKKAGTVILTLQYARSWESKEPETVLKYKVKVNNQKKIVSVKVVK